MKETRGGRTGWKEEWGEGEKIGQGWMYKEVVCGREKGTGLDG